MIRMAVNEAEAILPETELRSLRALQLAADSQRHRILTLLIAEAMTATEVARRIGIGRTRVYYHLGLLEEHGMIRIVDQRRVGAVLERTYRAVARVFRVDRKLLGATATTREIASAEADILASAADDARGSEDEDMLVARTFARLGKRDAKRLRAEMVALFRKYRELTRETAETYEVVMALFRSEEVA